MRLVDDDQLDPASGAKTALRAPTTTSISPRRRLAKHRTARVPKARNAARRRARRSCFKSARRLGRQRDLGNENDRAPALAHDMLDRLDIHERFAAAGDAVEQHLVEVRASSGRRFVDCARLFRRRRVVCDSASRGSTARRDGTIFLVERAGFSARAITAFEKPASSASARGTPACAPTKQRAPELSFRGLRSRRHSRTVTRDIRACADRPAAVPAAVLRRASAPVRIAAASRDRRCGALRDGAESGRVRSVRRTPPRATAANAPEPTDSAPSAAVPDEREQIAHARHGSGQHDRARALRRACRCSAPRRNARDASRSRRTPAATSSRSRSGFKARSSSAASRTARDDERDHVAPAERHAHDVADAQVQIAGVVGQRQIEARRTNRRQHVDGARYRRTACGRLARAARAPAHRAVVALDAVLDVADGARQNEAQPSAAPLLVGSALLRTPPPDRPPSGAAAAAASEVQHAQMLALAEPPRPQRQQTRGAQAQRDRRAVRTRYADARSIACANVCPRLSSSRMPASSRSSATMVVFTFTACRDDRGPRPARERMRRERFERIERSSPSTIAALTISASPSRSAGGGSVCSALTSQKTATGSAKTPARFLPAGKIHAGLTADRRVDHRDQRRRDVRVGDAAHVGCGRESEDVARDAAADAQHERLRVRPRPRASRSCTRSSVARRLRRSPSGTATTGTFRPRTICAAIRATFGRRRTARRSGASRSRTKRSDLRAQTIADRHRIAEIVVDDETCLDLDLLLVQPLDDVVDDLRGREVIGLDDVSPRARTAACAWCRDP